jgi:hypothetical protein
MTVENEKIKILQMIESGKITADQGIELINACSESEARSSRGQTGKQENAPQWVKVIVTDLASGKKRVNIRMPAALVSTGAKFGARLSLEKQDFNSEIIRDAIRAHRIGKILDVADDKEHERVEIILE